MIVHKKNQGIDPIRHYALEETLKNTIRFLEIGILELINEIGSIDESNKKEVVLSVRKKIKTKYNIDKVHSDNFLRHLKTEDKEELNIIRELLNAT